MYKGNKHVVFSIFTVILINSFNLITNAFKPPMSEIQTNLKSYRSTSKNSISTNSMNEEKKIRIGFIGCGTIAASIATGLATSQTLPDSVKIEAISVTKRSEAKSSALLAKFPELINVFDDDESNSSGQKVANASDIVFVCLLPQQVATILPSIHFDPERHVLVSLASTTNLDELALASKLSSKLVFKMICLPSVATQQGTCLLVPKGNSLLKTLFESLGGCVECENEDIMKALMVPTSLMGPFYQLLKTNRDWLVRQGVPDTDASYFVTKQYLSMLRDAELDCENPSRLDALIDEQTPGGLNEQSIKNLDSLGIYKAYDSAMDATLSRLNGESDGSV